MLSKTAISVTYESIDGARKSRVFKTLKGARNFAQRWVGATPEISRGFGYAVSADGIGRILWYGCSARDLFPEIE